MYNQTNNVNIKPKSYLPEFHVSQNDVGRTLTAHLVQKHQAERVETYSSMMQIKTTLVMWVWQ